MINIRPVSDLRNKYPEIEDIVLREDEAVYLTKNGYGSMVVMSLKKYANLMEEVDLAKAISAKFGNINIDQVLSEMDEEISNPNSEFLTHEEVFSKLRRKMDEE